MSRTSNVVDFQTARGARMSTKAHGGYIRLYRSVFDAAFSNKPNHFSAWVHMLGMATHKPIKTMLGGRSIELQRGQFVSGRKALADRIGITEKQLRNILDFLVSEGMISLDPRRAGTVFTILNFDFYQDPEGQRSTPLEPSKDAGFSEKRASEGPTRGQPRANDLGQQKGQAQASNHGGCSDSGANERANPKTAKRATKQEDNNIYTTTPTARACEDSQQGGPKSGHPPQAEVEVLAPHPSGQSDRPESADQPQAHQAGAQPHSEGQPDPLSNTGQPRDMATSKPPPAPPDTFSMHLDWQPSEAFPHRCRQAGIDLERIDGGDATTWLGEFRSYWEANATECTQAKWEHKLIKQLFWQLEQQANKAKSEKPDWNDTGWAKGFDPFDEFSEFRAPPRANPLDPKERRAAITASVMDVTNTDWG